MTTGE